MKNSNHKKNYYLLILIAFIIFSCNSGKEKCIIEEIEKSTDDTAISIRKHEVTSFGSSFSYSTNSNNEAQEVKDVKISFSNEPLSAILEKLEYPYNKADLKKDPILNIDYYRENITKEKAVKDIISKLTETYQF
ncbi:hypothetical protein [Algibacter lectus]|uniref:Lipoprotein n=1 Tax=Algibacter lectus TaxID=221126 RepID=A0A4R8M7R4_9FLAO|nr:hypothetical protein [Algibacter lectus]MWW25647.1 hypothetical protein [Algibacter lectus]TDY60928.1 hypothetical protein DFQ06_2935 [Algibacter lectus]